MKCDNCGAIFDDGARFCAYCGSQLHQHETREAAAEETAKLMHEMVCEVNENPDTSLREPEEEVLVIEEKKTKFSVPSMSVIKEKVKKNPLYIIAGIIVFFVFVLLVASIVDLSKGNGFVEYNRYYFQKTNEDGEYIIIRNNKKIGSPISVDDDNFKYYGDSFDGRVMIFVADDDLYIVKNDKIKKAVKDVKNADVSLNGKSVLYNKFDEEDSETVTYMYNVKSGKSQKIFTSDNDKTLTRMIMTPDGKGGVYTVKERDEDEENGYKYLTYYFNGSESTKITSTELAVHGVSNKAKYIWVTTTKQEDGKSETVLYLLNKNGDKKKIGKINDTSSIKFNADCTQIMYTNQNSKGNVYTYMSIKGKSPVRLAKGKLSLVTSGMDVINIRNALPVKNLYGHVYTASNTDGGINAYLVKKNDYEKLASDVQKLTLDSKGRYLYYIDSDDDDALYVLEIEKGESAVDKAVKIAEEVDAYVVTSDRKYVYYVSDEGLYRASGKKAGKPKCIVNDGILDSLEINDNNVVYYIDEDHTVYATTGGKGKRIADDVDNAYSIGKYMYIEDEDGSISVTTGKKKPKKLISK